MACALHKAPSTPHQILTSQRPLSPLQISISWYTNTVMLRLLVTFLDNLLCHWPPSFSVAYSLTATDGERRLERVPHSLTPGYNPVTLGCSPGLSFNWIRQIFKGKPIWKYSPPQTWEFLFQLFRGADGGPEIRLGAPRKWIYETKNTASRNSVRAVQVLLQTVHKGLRM
jgi:hypothetical protein